MSHVACFEEIRNACTLFWLGKRKGKYFFGDLLRWEGNIKMNLRETEREFCWFRLE
jgi:hypothetical protein